MLDQKALDQHVRLQPQVRPAQCRLEEAAGARPAPAALLVDMKIADALIVAGVEVRDFFDSHLSRCLADGIEHRPGQPRRLDAPAAADPVMLAFAEEMILELPKQRPDIVTAPA